MRRWKPGVALLAALAVAIIWLVAGYSAGVAQIATAAVVFAVVWLALGLLPGKQSKTSPETVVLEQIPEQKQKNQIPSAQRELLAEVSSALADQQQAFDDTEDQLRDLRVLERRLLKDDQSGDMADASRYRLATVRSQIEQLETLMGTISTNIVALQTQRGAVQTIVAAQTMPSPDMVMTIQHQLQQSQATLAIADEGTRSIHELTADMARDREDLIDDLINDPVGERTRTRDPEPVSTLAEPEA